jgi:hypothetical protein
METLKLKGWKIITQLSNQWISKYEYHISDEDTLQAPRGLHLAI